MNDIEEKNRSFHGKLLDRGQTCLPARKRDRLTKFAKRGNRLGVATWLAWLVGEGAILAGGLSLGAGIMRYRFGQSLTISESSRQTTDNLIVVGVICLVVGVVCILGSVLARQMAKSGAGSVTQAARG